MVCHHEWHSAIPQPRTRKIIIHHERSMRPLTFQTSCWMPLGTLRLPWWQLGAVFLDPEVGFDGCDDLLFRLNQCCPLPCLDCSTCLGGVSSFFFFFLIFGDGDFGEDGDCLEPSLAGERRDCQKSIEANMIASYGGTGWMKWCCLKSALYRISIPNSWLQICRKTISSESVKINIFKLFY